MSCLFASNHTVSGILYICQNRWVGNLVQTTCIQWSSRVREEEKKEKKKHVESIKRGKEWWLPANMLRQTQGWNPTHRQSKRLALALITLIGFSNLRIDSVFLWSTSGRYGLRRHGGFDRTKIHLILPCISLLKEKKIKNVKVIRFYFSSSGLLR